MIKATVTEVKPQLHAYPKLMKSVTTGNIVLFSSEGVGTLLSQGVTRDIGDFRDEWLMENFEDYHGAVTLKNT